MRVGAKARTMGRRWALAAALAMAGPATAGPAGVPTDVEIAPHRAIYALELERAESGSGVVGAGGQMQFEWADSCDGWTVEQRYRLAMRYAETGASELQISFVTWEARDGGRYRFNVRKLRDGDVEEELRGEARSEPAGAAVEFLRPERRSLTLKTGTVFPSIHTLVLIDAARRGELLVDRPVFDGGAAEGAFDVTAAIGKPQPAEGKEPLKDLAARWWPVRMAFFPVGGAEAAPDYEMGIDLQENGVVRAMRLDYGGFVVRARLTSLERLAAPAC